MADNRNNTDIAALDMLNNAAAVHTAVWDPTEPAATRPLLLQTPSGWFTCGFDQVKNVTELFDASGNIAASYDYAPFGATLSAAGPAAALTPFRFSSEVWDSTLGLVDYTFRPYNPLDGRFVSRDPIGEDGGLNLYGFVKNNAICKWDSLGLVEWEGVLTISAAEAHSFGCREWTEFSGQGDYESYLGHFIKYTLREWLTTKVSNIPLTVPNSIRAGFAATIVVGLGMIRGDKVTLRAVNLRSSKSAYSKEYPKDEGCARDVMVQIEVAKIEKMKKGDPEEKIGVVFDDASNLKKITTEAKTIKVK
jgi:RHS repeat-associated protein